MNDRYLFKAKHTHVLKNSHLDGIWVKGYLVDEKYIVSADDGYECLIDPNTICQCTGLKDKNGKPIWENDILMCHGNPKELVKATFGKFIVINAEILENIDEVIGWHYEVIPTDTLSKCEPFCLSMSLTKEYVKACEFEVIGNIFDNEELLESEEE